MKKYLGIVKVKKESAIGIDIQILVKFSNTKKQMRKWMRLYPDAEKIVLNNDNAFQKFFEDFEDIRPVTDKEKENAQKLYEEIMKN